MIGRDFNRAQRDMQMRKLPVYREPDTAWQIISASPRALIGSLAVGAMLIGVGLIIMAIMP